MLIPAELLCEQITALRDSSQLLSGSGLPDGLFSNQKYQFGKILEGLAMENLGIFNDHLVYLLLLEIF
jgi:hypothetical protein